MSGRIVPESIHLPEFGAQLEARFGKIRWLNPLWNYGNDYPPSRYSFSLRSRYGDSETSVRVVGSRS